MPDWLERLINRNAGVEFLPLVVCIGTAVAVWWWQWAKSKKTGAEPGGQEKSERPGKALRVGWGPGLAVLALVVLGVAVFATTTGIAVEAWGVVREDPWLAAWWIMGVGGAVIVWGAAVHAWRAEGRLARQCRRCRYDMTAVPGLMKCPECGRVAKSERQLRPVNVRRWAMWIGAAVIAIGLLMPTAMSVLYRGWPSAMPGWALMRWAVATSNPPEGVILEIGERIRENPKEWESRLGANRDALTLRLLDSSPGTRLLYQSLLQGSSGSLSAAVSERAEAAVMSEDIERRRAGLSVIVLAGEGGKRLPFAVLKPLLTDNDPATVQNAMWIVMLNRDAYLEELTSKGGSRDTESLRQLMRSLTSGNMFQVPFAEAFAALREDPDPEIAARATLTAFFHALHTQAGATRELTRAAVLAVATSDAAGPNQRSRWLDPVSYFARPVVGDAMRSMIGDTDPAVRRALFTQMEALSALYPGGVPTLVGNEIKTPRILEEFLPALREQLTREDDPVAKQRLQKLIDSIDGKLPVVAP